MPGSSNSTTTQSTSSTPWDPAQPLLKTGLSDASKLYKSGVGSGVYTGSTVIPFSRPTASAMSGLSALAKNNITGRGVVNSAQDIMNQGGFNDQQLASMKSLKTASRQNDALYRSLGGNGLSADQDAAMRNFRSVANSNFDYSPDFQSVLDASLADARTGVNANAAAAGRYGSGVAQGVMADRLGRISNEARLGEYRDWQDRKSAANQNMANLGQTGIGNLSSLIGNKQNIASTLFNAGQAGLGNLRDAYGVAQMPFQTQMQLGGMYEDLAGRLKNDELRIFNEKQNQPWNQIGRLMQVGNLGGQYTSSNTTSQQPGQNPFLSALGYGTGGLSLLGGLLG